MNTNKKTWAWIGAILVLVIAVTVFVSMQKKNVADTDDSATVDTAITPTEDVSTGSVNATATKPVTISYQAALIKYANSRIQFTKECQATPNAPTFKTGTLIMLDNRAPQARTIHLGSLGSVSIKGYGFKIIQLSLSGLTTNAIAVDCDASQNVAIITVQK